MMWFGFVTLFPEMFQAVTVSGVTGRAVRDGLLGVEIVNPRDFTHDKHRTVDDRPYGGGPGMLMKIQPLRDAIHCARARASITGCRDIRTVYLSPQGRPLNHEKVVELSHYDGLVLVCGRYEGVDERLIDAEIDEETALGDFVLSGGEVAAMAVFDSVARCVPGVLGHEQSAFQDSFVDGLLDCPHYTRPEIYEGRAVPAVLLGGNHAEIERWRRKQSLGRTFGRRPDLLQNRVLTQEDRRLLDEYQKESGV